MRVEDQMIVCVCVRTVPTTDILADRRQAFCFVCLDDRRLLSQSFSLGLARQDEDTVKRRDDDDKDNNDREGNTIST